MKTYDLYVDESGSFTEGRTGDSPSFPSQLAGVLAPSGTFDEPAAEKILREAFGAIDEPLPERVHATDLGRGKRLDTLVEGLCGALESRDELVAVRFENREGLGFGTIEATYTRMIAELCVRVLEQLAREHDGQLGLNLVGAIYMVEGEVELPVSAYKTRLEEHIAYAAVRQGLAQESARLKLASIRKGSGRTWRELQICDVLSNASHDGYGKLGTAAGARLRALFSPFDWTLTLRDLDRRVDELLDQGLVGLALRELAEQLVGGEVASAARRAAEARLPVVLGVLAGLGAPARAAELGVLDSWLEQLSEHRRDPEMGYRAARWLIDEVDAGLRARLPDGASSSDPFTISLWRHALTAANHRGALLDAREASDRFDTLLPSVAGRWELSPVVTEGLIGQAVHLTDCLEHEDAARRAGSVASYFGELSSLFSVALPGVFPEAVRSEQRGKALGTQLQAEMYAALRDPSRFDVARQLNDEAMTEFSNSTDRARQHQYRAQLETYAGAFQAARDHLARSIGTEPTHAAIAAAIAGMPSVSQGFALLHWLRLGAALVGASDDECDAFLTAWKSSKLHTSAWCLEERLPYPAHGVRRYQALLEAARGNGAIAHSILGRLRQLDAEPATHPLMALLVAAAQMEVAAMLWSSDRRGSERLLALKDGARPGAKQRLETLRPRVVGLPRIAAWIDSASAAIGSVLSEVREAYEVRDRLQSVTRLVAY